MWLRIALSDWAPAPEAIRAEKLDRALAKPPPTLAGSKFAIDIFEPWSKTLRGKEINRQRAPDQIAIFPRV